MNNLLCKIKEVKYVWRALKIGTKNLITWFPIIWKDRQWDHTFIYTIFRKKLSLTEHYIRNYGIHVDAKRDADRIKTCVLLLERLLEDEYHEMAFKRHHEKWGQPEMQFKKCEDSTNYSKLHIHHDKVITEQDEVNERKDFHNAYEHEQYLREQDLDLLFKTMRKHIQGWWD